MTSDTDVELMLRVKLGDKNAFRELVERHKGFVINVIHRQIGDRWEAEDLAQNVFINVFHSAQRYEPSAKFTTWLYTIVHNTCLNEIRRRYRHKVESLDAIQFPEDDAPARILADEHSNSPAEEAQESELEDHIRNAIRSLSEDQRMAIVLLRYENLSYEEIAKVMRCSLGATKSLIHRARQQLKSELLPYLGKK